MCEKIFLSMPIDFLSGVIPQLKFKQNLEWTLLDPWLAWPFTLFEYLERRDLLQTPAEQSRLLHEVPIVIAEPIEQEASVHGKGDGVKQGVNNSQQPIAEEASIIPICDNAADDADGSRNSEFAGFY